MEQMKRIYFFGNGNAEGDKDMKEYLGGKGANLAEMTSLGIPVPPGFTISTLVCKDYYENGNRLPEGLLEEINENISKLETAMGLRFGDPENPLLVSVRSGAAMSMPGMMDTVLNLGINDEVVEGLVKLFNNSRFAMDVYRRFIQMFGDVVMNIPHSKFEAELHKIKKEKNVQMDTELSADDLKELISRYRQVFIEEIGVEFPTDPREQLIRAIEAVFSSWNNPRAKKYRELNHIKGLIGTAVNVQAMVFGNLGDDSGTGVAFTRDPATGEKKFYGEYLINAQGEDVVAGIRTPKPIETLSEIMPDVYDELKNVLQTLEMHYRDMQDIEFTIQRGKLFLLQTRNGKRTAHAAVRIAVDMVNEGLIDKETAIMRVEPNSLDQLLHPVFGKEEETATVLTKGLAASPGAATGVIKFSAKDAEDFIKSQIERKVPPSERIPVILVRTETSPEDIGGMAVSEGILTARGGRTSHAAVVARGMGKCCVSGASDISINEAEKTLRIGNVVLKDEDWISLNGSRGTVYKGRLPTSVPQLSGPFQKLMEWADEIRRLKVRTNADNPQDTSVAVSFGAEGIGLCRTEHMFFAENRIQSFRMLIMVAETVKRLRSELESTEDPHQREKLQKELEKPLAQYTQALDELFPLQKADFVGIFKALNGRPATIRTLDPPLHEFLPKDEEGEKEMAETMNISVEDVRNIVKSLHEFNPMLGHRGCRLGISYPEVTEMQVRAIIEAAYSVYEENIPVHPEIMIPLVGHKRELESQRKVVHKVIDDFCREKGLESLPFDVMVGTMIEVPRAAITADEIAEFADFFSFGTNDLTQMCCGFSRDDSGSFLPDYIKMGIYPYDPFEVLDQDGVGLLVKIAIEKGRKTRPSLKIGICGEHGGEPRSVDFCHRAGLDYVSCSPFRVPIARLAAAQAVIREK